MTEHNTEIDALVETVVQQVIKHLDARIDTLKADLKAELAEIADHFSPRHDELSRRMTTVEKRFDDGMDLFSRWADGIQRNTGYTRMLAEAAFKKKTDQPPPAPATPEPNDPRPPEIDRAVNADPAGGVQRVDLPGYGAVLYLRPGTDAETAWVAARESIRAGRMP